MIIVFSLAKKYTFRYKPEQYHREADSAKTPRNIMDFRVNMGIRVRIADKYFL